MGWCKIIFRVHNVVFCILTDPRRQTDPEAPSACAAEIERARTILDLKILIATNPTREESLSVSKNATVEELKGMLCKVLFV